MSETTAQGLESVSETTAPSVESVGVLTIIVLSCFAVLLVAVIAIVVIRVKITTKGHENGKFMLPNIVVYYLYVSCFLKIVPIKFAYVYTFVLFFKDSDSTLSSHLTSYRIAKWLL